VATTENNIVAAGVLRAQPARFYFLLRFALPTALLVG
jgi:hypothetical protein